VEGDQREPSGNEVLLDDLDGLNHDVLPADNQVSTDAYQKGNEHGYCPDHRTGVKLPDDFVVTPLQYLD
jgi:hypothetical protein